MTDRARQTWLSSAIAVFSKELRSEFRTRYAINALIMFVVTTISMILFAIGREETSLDVLIGMFWVVIFFGSMSGMSRTFVAEEERGTAMVLQLLSPPPAVLLGKLVFNVVLSLCLNGLTLVLYLLFIDGFQIATQMIFCVVFILGSVGLAAASTIIAAIVAKSNVKGTLYPVLAFPIVLPLLMSLIHATQLAGEGAFFEEALPDFQVIVSYIVVVIAVSFLVFRYVWKE